MFMVLKSTFCLSAYPSIHRINQSISSIVRELLDECLNNSPPSACTQATGDSLMHIQ